MKSTALLIVPLLLTAAPASAGSAFLDLSQPMTGVSKFVFDVDGKPVQLGAVYVPPPPEPEPSRAAREAAGPACGGNAGDPNCQAARPQTAVSSNGRNDGAGTGRTLIVLTSGSGQTPGTSCSANGRGGAGCATAQPKATSSGGRSFLRLGRRR